MNIDVVRENVRNIIDPVINALGIELVDAELSMMKGKALLRVFIDREEGITIDDCERVSRDIEAVLDVEDPIPSSYVLEVSSPGLDRPLNGPKDFRRFMGNAVRVVVREPIGNQTFFVGKIADAGDNDVLIALPKENEIRVPYKNITKARLEVEV